METLLTMISEENFDQLKCPFIFSRTEFDRSFGIISRGTQMFGISWQSDIVDPVIKQMKPEIYGVGIDLNFVILDFLSNSTIFEIHFDSFFIDCLVFETAVYVVTEMTIFEVCLKNYKLSYQYDLPDIFVNASTENHRLIIKCMDGGLVTIKLKDSDKKVA